MPRYAVFSREECHVDTQAVSRLFAAMDRELWVVTGEHAGRRSGLVATFVSQASIVPELPRVVVGLARQHATWELVDAAGAFALHLLGAAQRPWVEHFGLRSGRDTDKFAGLAVRQAATGAPILADAAAWLDCRVEARLETGDRTLFLAEVVAAQCRAEVEPLTLHAYLREAPEAVRHRLKQQLDEDARRDAEAIGAWRRARGSGS
jgi:flavin reductase (DIM6/NTAB) family NADH-FMN oxidoreductase RutF